MLFLLSLINEIVPLIVGHKLDSVKEDITGLQLSGGKKKSKKKKASEWSIQWVLTSFLRDSLTTAPVNK